MKSFYKPFVTLFFFLGNIMTSIGQSEMTDCPSSLEVNALETCGDYQFTLGEGQPNEDVYWYFDDGSYEDHVSYTTIHHYNSHGTYAGYAQYTSDLCPTTTYNFFLIVPSCSTDDVVEQNQFTLQIYPNPVVDRLTINGLNINSLTKIEIFSFEGKKIVEEKCNCEEYIIDIPTYLEGFYLLQITTDNEIIQKRIFANR